MRRVLSLFLIATLALCGLSPLAAQPAPGTLDFDPQNPPTETRVMRGETLYAIAERTRSPLVGLIQVNALRAPFALTPGQTLKLPPLKVHIVRRNETFSAISRRYNVDERSLALFNRLPRPVKVLPGQRIILPALVRDQLTGLEPQDLVALLATELAAGRSVSGGVPGQLRPNSEAGSVATVPPLPPKRPVTETPKAKPGPLSALPNFAWPVRGRLVETFGTKADLRVVDGIEIEAPSGTPFKAAASGQVAYVGNQLAGYGWLVLIRHSSDYMTAYAFANSVNVREGQTVTRGQVIGQVGQTGRARSPRLHFQVRHATKPVDPVPFLAAGSANPT
jgi:murein DD-endopeptidase MepM/ murein hydrolase activator NlpD